MPPQDPGPVLAVGARRAERKRRAAKAAVNLPFDVVESKLHVPVLRPGVVSRTALGQPASRHHRLPGRCGHRTRRLWEDDALGAVGRSRQASIRVGLDRRARQRPSRPPQASRRGYPPGRGARRAGPQRAPVSREVDVGGRDSASGIGARLARASARPRARRCALASFARLAGRGFRARRSHATGLPARPGRPRSTASAHRRAAYERPPPRARRRRARAVGPGGESSSSRAPGPISSTTTSRSSLRAPKGGPPALYLAALSLRERDGTKTARDRRPSRSPEMTATWPTTSAPSTSPGSHPSI